MNEELLGRQIPRDVAAIVARMLAGLPPEIDATADEDEIPENPVEARGQSRRSDETKEAMASPAADVPDGFPVPAARISSWFGMRFHPLLKAWKPHNGVDLACAIGTPVRAIAAGVINVAGALGGYGNVVFIDHRNGFQTRYGHLSSVEVLVDQVVERGEVVGASGMSGRATGPHLHLEVLWRNKPVDPIPFLGVG